MTVTSRTLADLELVGNELCLDFANTVNSRRRTEHDYLGSYADLLEWSINAGGLGAPSAMRLRRYADLPAAASVLGDAHRLRETIVAVFVSVAHGKPPARGRVDELSTAYATAMRHARLEPGGNGFMLGWAMPDDAPLDAPLWPIAHSAGELLISSSLERVGECPGCGWLFLDVSRNGTRRWCSMATCGSRDKMSRYHERRRNLTG